MPNTDSLPFIWKKATSSALRCKFHCILLYGTLLTCLSCHAFQQSCFKCCTLKAMVRINGSAALNLELIFHEWRNSESSWVLPKQPILTGGVMIGNYLDVNRKERWRACKRGRRNWDSTCSFFWFYCRVMVRYGIMRFLWGVIILHKVQQVSKEEHLAFGLLWYTYFSCVNT